MLTHEFVDFIHSSNQQHRMPIRYVGRKSYFKGKTLFEIASNLKNSGEGRVVTRWNFLRYEEPSYYRLTKVAVDLSNKETPSGQAWGIKVFRGQNFGERLINVGKKPDWRLIAKEDETTFCKEIYEKRPPNKVPSSLLVPPLLALLTKQELSSHGKSVTEPLKMKLKIQQSFLNNSVKEDV